MIKSMTGYGEASGQVNGVDYSVEIKAVNNRYLRAIIKLPEAVAFLEERVEKLLREHLSRGTVNYTLRARTSVADDLFEIDEKALRSVAQRLSEIQRSAQMESTFDISNLLNLPGIVSAPMPTKETTEQITEGTLALSRAALTRVNEMRTEEGRFLAADLRSHCQAIKADMEVISGRRAVVMEEHAEKIKKRVDALLAEAKLELNQETLAREVAILAERSDIAEELARLDAHLHQFEQTCRAEGGDQAGRRLDFIGQELLREANTIASKANDFEIGTRVVNMKCHIDRIKEQTLNVE
jgi:uncharacterized protein (TIGR00255 family)